MLRFLLYLGSPRTHVTVEENEIKQYIDARYVSAQEAMWHLNQYEMVYKSHKVERMYIHLENLQNVIFEDQNEVQALQRAAENDTKLLGWFKLNKNDTSTHGARQYLYCEIGQLYI
jgi:hypothetical protein